MIDKIKLKSGSSAGEPNLEIDLTPITVFVGPNNSGKSRVLVEIEHYCRQPVGRANQLILENLTFTPLLKDEIEDELSKIEQHPMPNEGINADHIFIEKVSAQNNESIRYQIHKESLILEAQNPNGPKHNYSLFLNMYTLRLDGTNRLNLLRDQTAGDLLKTPINHLAQLFSDNYLRKELSRIIFEAFGKYFVIDPTNIGTLRVRLSDTEPTTEREEKGWETESVNFHKKGLSISETSDGVRAFTGILERISKLRVDIMVDK